PIGPGGARDKQAIQESRCYWAEADVLAQSNAPPCRNLLDKRSDNSPLPIRPLRDWVEDSGRSRLPVVLLHVKRPLVEDSLCGSRANPCMRAAPRQGRTSGPTAPLP